MGPNQTYSSTTHLLYKSMHWVTHCSDTRGHDSKCSRRTIIHEEMPRILSATNNFVEKISDSFVNSLRQKNPFIAPVYVLLCVFTTEWLQNMEHTIIFYSLYIYIHIYIYGYKYVCTLPLILKNTEWVPSH